MTIQQVVDKNCRWSEGIDEASVIAAMKEYAEIYARKAIDHSVNQANNDIADDTRGQEIIPKDIQKRILNIQLPEHT